MDVSLPVKVSNHDNAFFIVIIVQKPSDAAMSALISLDLGLLDCLPWRFTNDQTAETQQGSHDTLHQERRSPRVVALHVTAEVVHPNTGSITSNIARELDTGQLATIVRRTDLRLVDRYNRGERSDTKTGDESPNHHHGHTICKGLEHASNEENHGSIEDGTAASDNVSDPTNTY